MSRQHIIERERRLRPFVIATSVLAFVFFIVGSAVQAGVGPTGDLPSEFLRTLADNKDSFLLGSIVGSLGILLLIVPLVYLFRAAHARTDRMLGGLVALAVLGPALFTAQAVMLASAQVDIAEQFVAQEKGVGDIYSLATNLFDNSGARSTAQAVGSVGFLALVVTLVYTPLWGHRTGLLTRMHGAIGMAIGASLVLAGIVNPALGQAAIPALLIWFLYFGLVQSGRTRAGRPPAWDAGVAIPWPAPGEQPQPESAPADEDVVEGDAHEIPGVGENPNAARRERAKRRKRKRRR